MKNLLGEISLGLKQAKITKGYCSGRAFAPRNNLAHNGYLGHQAVKREMSLKIIGSYMKILKNEPAWSFAGKISVPDSDEEALNISSQLSQLNEKNLQSTLINGESSNIGLHSPLTFICLIT